MPAGAKVVSEKREKKTLVRVIFIAPNTGAVVPPLQIFFLERIDTPTGRMLIVTDDEQRLRAVDWEDHERRIQKLLRRHYGAEAIQLREMVSPSAAQHALQAYFEGSMDALTHWPVATSGLGRAAPRPCRAHRQL
jgi:hypothetical protein